MAAVTVAPFRTINSGKSSKDRLVEGENILRAYNNGTPVSELVETFGLSQATVYRRLDEALKARIAPTVDQYREVQNAALDEQMRKWAQQIDAAEAIINHGIAGESIAAIEKGMNLRAAALQSQLRVLERRARLNGLDAPVKAEVTVNVTDGIDRRVSAMLTEMEQAEVAG